MDLSAAEIRVLGCLLEKQRTTPDVYPLSLNSLRLACNQSTNRDPVVDYDDGVIRDALHRLERRGYARLAGASRAPKFRHLLADALPMGSDEQAVMCVLMLRGSQTPGELKGRTDRMHIFADLTAVLQTLDHLIERELVARLDRRPGQKEERYEQLLGSHSEPAQEGSPTPARHELPNGSLESTFAPSTAGPSTAAVSGVSPQRLEERVECLEREVAELRAILRNP